MDIWCHEDASGKTRYSTSILLAGAAIAVSSWFPATTQSSDSASHDTNNYQHEFFSLTIPPECTANTIISSPENYSHRLLARRAAACLPGRHHRCHRAVADHYRGLPGRGSRRRGVRVPDQHGRRRAGNFVLQFRRRGWRHVRDVVRSRWEALPGHDIRRHQHLDDPNAPEVVDICEHGASASKRGPLKSVEISEAELIRSVDPHAVSDGLARS